MKNKKTGKWMVFMGAFGLMCMMSGCGKVSESTEKREEDIIKIEATADDSGQQEQKDEHAEEEKTNEAQEAGGNPAQAEPETASGESSNDMPDNTQYETELEGTVKSIGEGSMVVSKIFTYTEDGKDIAVSYVGDGPDDALITVYFAENTEFIVRTVKNGGVNGDSDVEDRAGSVSDILEGNSVLMTGSYEGEDFRAEQVVIYNFV